MSLIELKKKIQATKNTKKITKAMQLVAASKMKMFQKKSSSTRLYTRDLLKALRLAGLSLESTSYGKLREDGATLFVLLTSDKGLCGAMNARLLRTLYQSNEWKELPPNKRKLITVGRKATDSAKHNGQEVLHGFSGLSEEMTPLDAIEIISQILHAWEEQNIKNVRLISPWYINPFVFETTIKTFLPLSQATVTEHLAKNEVEVKGEQEFVEAAFFEPSQDEVVEKLAEQVVQALFIEAFFELKATEYSSRMVAMKKATEAADDQIKIFTQAFNKARQSAITQQLAELASANEAMSGANDREYFT